MDITSDGDSVAGLPECCDYIWLYCWLHALCLGRGQWCWNSSPHCWWLCPVWLLPVPAVWTIEHSRCLLQVYMKTTSYHWVQGYVRTTSYHWVKDNKLTYLSFYIIACLQLKIVFLFMSFWCIYLFIIYTMHNFPVKFPVIIANKPGYSTSPGLSLFYWLFQL